MGQPGQAEDSREAGRGPWPVSRDGVASGPSGCEPKSDRDDQRVIGVAQDGNEVRDEIDRRDQIQQQRAQPEPDTGGQSLIGGEALQQTHHIWGKAQKIHERRTARVFALLEPEHENKHQPEDHQPANDAEGNLPPLRHCYEPSRPSPAFELGEVVMTRFSQQTTSKVGPGHAASDPTLP